MNLSELVKVLSSEEKAEEFLRSKGILKTFENCPLKIVLFVKVRA
jgi:transposase